MGSPHGLMWVGRAWPDPALSTPSEDAHRVPSRPSAANRERRAVGMAMDGMGIDIERR